MQQLEKDHCFMEPYSKVGNKSCYILVLLITCISHQPILTRRWKITAIEIETAIRPDVSVHVYNRASFFNSVGLYQT